MRADPRGDHKKRAFGYQLKRQIYLLRLLEQKSQMKNNI